MLFTFIYFSEFIVAPVTIGDFYINQRKILSTIGLHTRVIIFFL